MEVNFDLTMHRGWESLLSEFLESERFGELLFFLQEEYAELSVFPPAQDVFRVFRLTDPETVRVVILGQDPYYRRGQAEGLAFSVPLGVKSPPSLKNIFKELHSDLGLEIPEQGSLEVWARQGVLLLNTVLTVREGKPGSHRGCGWEEFTDFVIKKISALSNSTVFFLWGGDAHKKERLIDSERNLVLKAAHPSPLSAHRGFLGCRHFSKANEFLIYRGRKPVNWGLGLQKV